jgi:ammonia channel protein AmtB
VAIGFAARGRVKRAEATNHGVTVTGIVLGIVSIVVGLIFIPVWAAIVIGGIRDDNYNNCMQKAGSDKYLQQICAE